MKLIAGCGMMVVLAVTALGQAVSAPPGRLVSTLALLDQRIPDVSFQDAPLDQVLEWFETATNVKIVVRWQILEDAGLERDKPISIRVSDVRLSQALWFVMNEAGGADLKLAYRASGNILTLSTQDDLGREMLVKTYDVSDLLVRVPNFQGPEVELSQVGQNLGQQGGGGGGQSLFQDENDNDDDQDEEDNAEIQELINLIVQTIEPDTWALNGGTGTISAFRRTLVVRNNPFVHQRLGGYLEEE